MQRILFISEHGDPLAPLGRIQSGGQNVYVRELVLALDQLGWAVDVFTHWSEEQKPRVEKLGSRGRVIRLAAGRKGFVPKDEMFSLLPAFVEELLQWTAENNTSYRLLHTHYWLSGWAGMKLASRWEIPQVHVSHSLGLVKARHSRSQVPEIRIKQEKRVLHKADMVVATSPQEKEVLCSKYGVPTGKVSVIPCGIDPARFAPRDQEKDRQSLGWDKREKIILFVGRPEPAKGLEILVRSLAYLKEALKGEKITLMVIGGTQTGIAQKPFYLDYLQNLAGVAGQVHFLGPVPHENLPLYYGAAEVCAVPSFYESFGLVAVEAMACGCPVVASAVGGLQYTVRNGLTGLTVSPGEPQELARALQRILTDTTLRLTLSRQAARWVAHHFTWPQIARRISNLYQELLTWKNTAVKTSVPTSF